MIIVLSCLIFVLRCYKVRKLKSCFPDVDPVADAAAGLPAVYTRCPDPVAGAVPDALRAQCSYWSGNFA